MEILAPSHHTDDLPTHGVLSLPLDAPVAIRRDQSLLLREHIFKTICKQEIHDLLTGIGGVYPSYLLALLLLEDLKGSGSEHLVSQFPIKSLDVPAIISQEPLPVPPCGIRPLSLLGGRNKILHDQHQPLTGQESLSDVPNFSHSFLILKILLLKFSVRTPFSDLFHSFVSPTQTLSAPDIHCATVGARPFLRFIL